MVVEDISTCDASEAAELANSLFDEMDLGDDRFLALAPGEDTGKTCLLFGEPGWLASLAQKFHLPTA